MVLIFSDAQQLVKLGLSEPKAAYGLLRILISWNHLPHCFAERADVISAGLSISSGLAIRCPFATHWYDLCFGFMSQPCRARECLGVFLRMPLTAIAASS